MSYVDVFASIVVGFTFVGTIYHIREVKKLEEQLAEARKLAAELKQKMSANSHPILSLADLMNRGVLLDVSVVDRANMYFHNGSVR
jgi:hypothetical protein